jgi:hypothetical protein
MSDSMVNTRHSLTGKVQRVPVDIVAAFPDYLQVVADDAKPFEPGLFKPGKVGEFDNPEPLTDAELAAQAELEAAKESDGPRSKAAREAKAALDEAHAEAEANQEEAAKTADAVTEGNA